MIDYRLWLGRREREAVTEVVESGQLATGPAVRAFEREFADACDATFGVVLVTAREFEALDWNALDDTSSRGRPPRLHHRRGLGE